MDPVRDNEVFLSDKLKFNANNLCKSLTGWTRGESNSRLSNAPRTKIYKWRHRESNPDFSNANAA
jgi:hypothetical protein